jgi:type IV secretion system protein VirB8
MSTEPEVAEYLEAARGWDLDRTQSAERSARRAWRVAAAALLLTALALVAVAGLTPFKTVAPFVIRVDNATGVVDVVPALEGSASEAQAVTRYLVTQYVIVRERYVATLAESDYETVGAYHGAAMNQAWAALWNRNNPESPLNLHADGSAVRVQVLAVSFLAPGSGREDLVQVRFARFTGEPGNERESRYVATLQYAYGSPSKDDRLRALNPLGFKVLEYRREPEVMEVAP